MRREATNSIQRKKWTIPSLLMLLGLVLLIAGCSDKLEAADDELKVDLSPEQHEQNEQVIHHILKTEFTVPNAEYQVLVDKMLAWTPSEEYEDEETEYQAFINSSEYKAVFDYSVAQYEPYFTELGYVTFMKQNTPMKYINHNHDFTLSVSDIDIMQKDAQESVHAAIYEFTFKANYIVAGEEAEQFDFKGKATFGEDGKMRGFEYLDEYDNGLFEKMMSDGAESAE